MVSLFSTPYYIPFVILSSEFPASMIKETFNLPFWQNNHFSKFISNLSCLLSLVWWVPHWPWCQLKLPRIITKVFPPFKIKMISQFIRYFWFFYSFSYFLLPLVFFYLKNVGVFCMHFLSFVCISLIISSFCNFLHLFLHT